MTRRQLVVRAFDPEHKRLLLAAHAARGGEKTRAQERVTAYVTACLVEAGLASARPRRRRRR